MLNVASWAAFPVTKASWGRKKRKELESLPNHGRHPVQRQGMSVCVCVGDREVLTATF